MTEDKETDLFDAHRGADWRDSLDPDGRPTHGPERSPRGCDHCDGPLDIKAPIGQYECPWCVAMYPPPEAPAPAFPPLPEGLLWILTVGHIGTIARADGSRLTVTLGWDALEQEYTGVAIEAADGASTEELLERHAHLQLGGFKTEAEGKAAAEELGRRWREGGKSMRLCDCGPIGAHPERLDMLRKHPGEQVHFEDPSDEAPEGAVCGAPLEAPGHPAQSTAGPRSTFHAELVTCAACRLRMGDGQRKRLDR